MKRRLFPGEVEIRSLGTLTLTTHRVVLHVRGWWGWRSEAVGLAQVSGTAVIERCGRVRLLVFAGWRALELLLDDARSARSMADTIDHASARGHVVRDVVGETLAHGAMAVR